MKRAFWSSEVGIFFRQIKQQGISHTIWAFTWRLRMAIVKVFIQIQDRVGWYRYPDWIRDNETAPQLEPNSNFHPLLSLLILCSSSQLAYLRDSLESLQAQSYSNWEAYVYFEDSDSLSSLISAFSEEPRILCRLAQGVPFQIPDLEFPGDWFGFINSGDTFASNGFAFYISEMEAHPSATIIYSDTDKLSPDGKTRYSPSFWPDWSPELLLSTNYLNQAFFLRDAMIDAAGKANNLEDALLRRIASANQIVHIPRVLFHIRDGQTSSWFGNNFQPTNLVAHLERTGRQDIKIQTSPISHSSQITWSFGQPLISIIIPTRDQVMLLEQCIESIFSNTSYNPFEIILVENNSQEQGTFSYYEVLKSKPQVKVLIHDQIFNYSEFNNWGAKHAQGDLLLFLNNDVECIDPGWLDEMARWASRPDIGIVGAKLLYPNYTIQHAGLVIGLEGHANHVFSACHEGYNGLFGSTEWYRDYSAVTGACMMMRKTVFDQIGGFDENYSVAFGDVEICQRSIHQGYRVIYTPFARLIHHEGTTRSPYNPPSDIRLASLHLRRLIEQGDPFYNPNLSLLTRIPTLRRRGELSSLKRLDLITEHMGGPFDSRNTSS